MTPTRLSMRRCHRPRHSRTRPPTWRSLGRSVTNWTRRKRLFPQTNRRRPRQPPPVKRNNKKRAAQIENVKSNARRIEYETLAREPMILDEM
jgi:hypothetical protein